MPVVIACPSCKQKMKAPDAAIGKAVKCPGCGSAIKVPASADAPAPAPAPAPVSAPAPRQPAPAAKAQQRRDEPEDDFDEEPRRGKGQPSEDEDDRPSRSKAQDDEVDEDQPRKPAAYLGLGFEPGTDDLEITDVYEKSPAAKAGLKVGDVIARLDGKKVSKRQDLGDFLHKKKPGDTIGIEVKGDDEEIEVKLTKRPAE